MNYGQDGWSWCSKCEGLFFAGDATKGRCPDGGQHDDTGSGFYTVQRDGSNAPAQEHWRWCWKCEGLFWAGNPTDGVCPRDGTEHDASESSEYVLHMAGQVARGQTGWRWCRNCEGLFFAGHGTGGVCEVGGPHDPTGSGDYVLRRRGEYTFDRADFAAGFQREFGSAPPAALLQLLAFVESDFNLVDIRWSAYVLATVRTESSAFVPIRERGCVDGRSPVCSDFTDKQGKLRTRPYGNPKRCPNLAMNPPQPCPRGGLTHTYYGRGYVQLTHAGNYRALSARLGRDDEFVHDPDAVLDPPTAYEVMSVGMCEGLFTTKKLSDFINDRTLDYVNARRIVNPKDTVTFKPTAANAERFQRILESALR